MIDPRRPLVVMYHYLWRDEVPIPAGIRPMRVSAFEAQLDWLQSRYEIVSAERFLERIGETSDRPPCLLTFDDGTRDHAELATPILARRGLSGVFFIVSDAARGTLMPNTHLVHWLLNHDETLLWAALESFARDQGDGAMLGSEADARRIYHYESPTRARIKYAINMSMPPALARAFGLSVLAEAKLDERELASRWFADEDQLRAMHAVGMTLALHGKTHTSLQLLGDAIASEIDDCAAFLRSITGTPPSWWACPFGGSGASESAHAAMRSGLMRAGVRAAVSTIASSVPVGCDPFAIPRIDCVNLPTQR